MIRKKSWIAFLPIVFMACNFLFPQDQGPVSSAPTPAPAQTTESSADSNASSAFTISRIHKTDGDLMTLLNAEAMKAQEMGLKPFLEFDATWCPPCIAIDKSINAKDPQTLQAFSGIYLIRADVEEWGWGDGKNFTVDAIPVYYELSENGQPTGRSINGGAWNEDIPENFAPVLDTFFHQ